MVISGLKMFCLWEPYSHWKTYITLFNSVKKEPGLCRAGLWLLPVPRCQRSSTALDAPQRVGKDSVLSWASMWGCSTGAHWGRCCLSCTQRLDTGLVSWAVLQLKTQSSRNRPWKQWEELSAAAAPFRDLKNFASVILIGTDKTQMITSDRRRQKTNPS